jgi:hypothetical protein
MKRPALLTIAKFITKLNCKVKGNIILHAKMQNHDNNPDMHKLATSTNVES